MEPGLALQEFLEFVVRGLVQYPERSAVEHEVEEGRHVYRVRLDPEDVGRVIGKSGYTISAIRSLVAAASQKYGVQVSVKLDEV